MYINSLLWNILKQVNKIMSADHHNQKLDSKLKLGIVLNTGFTIFEFIVGVFSGSLALISDAGHNLTDSLSLLISYFGNKVAKREANEEHTYGYGRATILTALLNALILLGLAVFIFYEAYQRILNPQPVEGSFIAIVAFFGIIINFSIAMLFRKDKEDLNIKSAYISMLYDALASVSAFVAGILIILTKQTIFDPIISIVIGLLVLKSGWGVIREALHVLLEGVPKGINFDKVKEAISGQDSLIKAVDDLHIWAISSQMSALSCHIIIEECDLEKSMQIVEEIKKTLKEKFHIEHATIETELLKCLPD